VGVDVADLLWPQPRVRERPPHRQLGADAVSRRLRDVVRVAGEPIAANLQAPCRWLCGSTLGRMWMQGGAAQVGMRTRLDSHVAS
jgi:hypothetical protein